MLLMQRRARNPPPNPMTTLPEQPKVVTTADGGVPKGKRRRRFTRDMSYRSEHSRAGRLEVRRRDLDMILAIAKNRFLNTTQVCRLFVCDCPMVPQPRIRKGQSVEIEAKRHRPNCSCTCGLGSRKGVHAAECPALFKDIDHVAHRLRELFQAGYLDRPKGQLQLRMEDGIGYGSVPMTYCVSDAGLELLGPERLAILKGYGKLSWVNKVDEGTRQFIEHTLVTADLSIGLDKAVRKYVSLQRLSTSQLQAGMSEERRTSQRPFAMRATYKNVKLTAVPDLVFALGHAKKGVRWNFMAELDRGHMPIERANFNQTSIMRKLVTYAKAFEDKVHQKDFGWRGFRVLILTTSEARMIACVKACKARFGTASVARIFMFGTLESAHQPLKATYRDGRGELVTLVPDDVLERPFFGSALENL